MSTPRASSSLAHAAPTPRPASDTEASGLPWWGQLALPPCGVNHAYHPVTVKRGDGRWGASIAKTVAIKEWEEGQGYALLAQGIPILLPETLVTLVLSVAMPADTYDIDAHVKLVQDLLATYLGRPHPRARPRTRKGVTRIPTWNDLRVRQLMVLKTLDKEAPGIGVMLFDHAAHAGLVMTG